MKKIIFIFTLCSFLVIPFIASAASVADCLSTLSTLATTCPDGSNEDLGTCNQAFTYYTDNCDNALPNQYSRADFANNPEIIQSIIEDRYDPVFESVWIMDPAKGTIACLADQPLGCFSQSECSTLGPDFYWESGSQECKRSATAPPMTVPIDATGGDDDSGSGALSSAISDIDSFLRKKPIRGETISGDLPTIIGNALRVFLGVVGSLALAIFIYGGIIWMTSGGNSERVGKAKNTLIWSVMGLVVILLSYTIVSFIIRGISPEAATERTGEERNVCIEQCIDQAESDREECENRVDPAREICLQEAEARERTCRIRCEGQFQ